MLVSDQYQKRGLGNELLRRVIQIARDEKLSRVSAEMLTDNVAMLLGPYRVESRIGAGEMGQVYRATDSRLNRFVAIKFLSAQFSDRFEREAKAIAALNHPNICQIYDIGPNYLVMEYIDGSPVVFPEQQPLAASEVLRLAVQIASALQAAHAQGIIHRDLKPANILLSTTGTVKLLDFGLAKQTAGTDTAQTADLSQTMGVTQPGTIMGKLPVRADIHQAIGKTVGDTVAISLEERIE